MSSSTPARPAVGVSTGPDAEHAQGAGSDEQSEGEALPSYPPAQHPGERTHARDGEQRGPDDGRIERSAGQHAGDHRPEHGRGSGDDPAHRGTPPPRPYVEIVGDLVAHVVHGVSDGASCTRTSRSTAPSGTPAYASEAPGSNAEPSAVTRCRNSGRAPTRSSSNRIISGRTTPTGSCEGSTRSIRRRSPTRVTRLSAVRRPAAERLKVPVDITRSNLSSGRRGQRGRGRRRSGRLRVSVRALADDPVRHERPAHAPRAHDGRDHDADEQLPQPFVNGTPLPLRAEEQGVPNAPSADGHRLQQTGCRSPELSRSSAACLTENVHHVSNSPTHERLSKCLGKYSDSTLIGNSLS